MNWSWIDSGLGALARKYNPLLDQLSQRGRIRFPWSLGTIDCVDIHSASLVGAALSRQKSICVVLPDDNPRRPALLFSYAVICHWWKNKDLNVSVKRPILYCGTRPGIREQLGQVVVAGLRTSLAGVFGQTHLTRGAGTPLHDGSEGAGHGPDTGLPRVITAYGPADPKALIEHLRPVFIAVDLGDAPELEWLAPLREAAEGLNIPVLAWSSNPLSSALEQFSGNAEIAKWPFTRAFTGNLTFAKAEASDLLFQPYIVTNINPVFVAGNPVTARGGALGEASLRLARLDHPQPGSLAHRTIQMHWQLLRTLEALAVPLDFYEAEVSKFWGLASLQNLEAACERLRSALGASGRNAQLLEETGVFLRTARMGFQEGEPPLWSGLTLLIHEEPEKGSARILVLPSRGRKELLIFALDDLTMGVQVWMRQIADAPYLHIPSVAELLLRKIQETGSGLTSPLTLQFWLRGLTLSPDDPEDLRRVAEVLSLPFIKQHYRRVAAAASRIRGLHRGLSIRLGYWLAAQSGGLHEAYDREVIDPELGLTFGDVRASIVIEKVTSIRRVSGTFPRADLGIIRRLKVMPGTASSPDEQKRLTEYIIAQVGDRASGRHVPECLDNYPHDVYFIGNLRSQDPGPQQGPTAPHLPELLNKLAPVAFGAEFLIVPGAAAAVRVRLQWACYYRVFPTHDQQAYQQGVRRAVAPAAGRRLLAAGRRLLAAAHTDAGNEAEEGEDDNDPLDEETGDPAGEGEEEDRDRRERGRTGQRRSPTPSAQ